MLNPCARELKARTGGSGGKLILDHSMFPFYDSQQGAVNGHYSRRVFEGCIVFAYDSITVSSA